MADFASPVLSLGLVGSEFLDALSRASMSVWVSLLLGLPLPSDDPDIHWVLRLPEGFRGVLAGLLAEPGRFPSLSMTLSPKDTVLRRNAVPGVTSMLFVGDPVGL